jgi:GTP-binding protein Era
MRQEVPHAIAVAIERTEEHDDGLLSIDATIVVEKPSQKGIVIGAKGQMLKEVGTAARKELEDKLSRRVFLRLWVKVKPDWRDRTNLLRELGVLP